MCYKISSQLPSFKKDNEVKKFEGLDDLLCANLIISLAAIYQLLE